MEDLPNPGAAGKLMPMVYEDAARPAAREIGEALGRSVRALLLPVRAALWTAEQTEAFLAERVERLLAGVGEQALQSPPRSIAMPVYVGVMSVDDNALREMFAALLATSMNRDIAARAHPAFAEAIKQITSDEARILSALADTPKIRVHAEMVATRVAIGGFNTATITADSSAIREATWPPAIALEFTSPIRGACYLTNLSRLGLIEWRHEPSAGPFSIVEETRNQGNAAPPHSAPAASRTVRTTRQHQGIDVNLTAFGKMFASACIRSE